MAQATQKESNKEPCKCSTWVQPARSCKSSTFCVMHMTSAASFCCHCASVRCAALGWACRTRCRRHSYQPQTSSGWRSKASGVASSIGSYCAHNPVRSSRKVGTPLSAETPAPLKKTIFSAFCKAAIHSGAKDMTFPVHQQNKFAPLFWSQNSYSGNLGARSKRHHEISHSLCLKARTHRNTDYYFSTHDYL